MNIYVQVYDNDGAFSVFEIVSPIKVLPDLTNIDIDMEKLILNDPYYSKNIVLNQGSYLSSIQIIQTISSLLNTHSYSDKLAIILNKTSIAYPQIFGPMENFTDVTAVIKKFFIMKI
jgi:hypothetical protein